MTTKLSEANIQAATLDSMNSGPKILSVAATDSSYVVTGATTVPTTGGYVKITGSGFVSGAQVLVDETPATSVAFVDSTTLQVAVPAKTAGTYFVYVVNPDGGFTIAVNAITYL